MPSPTLTFLRRALWFLAFLSLFIISLELIKSGARPLTLWFKPDAGENVTGALGAGWLIACLVMSGSPVAALALGLLDDGSLTARETFAMVTGSRLGAAFVVLVVGFVYDVRARRRGNGVYVGALALLTTFTIYLPSYFLGAWLLERRWLQGVRFGTPAELDSILDLLVKPVVRATGQVLPPWAQSLLGVILLILAFKVFDRFLPVLDPTGGQLKGMSTAIFRPWIPFAFGMIITCITLSVSVSLTLLVPLTIHGLVRRENIVPYILGANITTFVDTLLASLLLKDPAGFGVILCQVIAVSALSLPIVFVVYRPYERFVHALARAVTRDRLRLALFIAALFLVPLALVVLS